MADPQLQARRMFVTAEHPLERPVLQFACPIRLDGADFEVRRPAPAHGQHSRELLRELGYDAGRIEALEHAGVLRQFQETPV